MAKNKQFKKQLDHLRDSLRGSVDEVSRRFCRELTHDIAETFVDRAGRRLLARATPQDEKSLGQLKDIVDSMSVKQKDALSSVANIPIDKEGLVLFLEYGTGYVGYSSGGNPDAKSWTYAMHGNSYRYHNGRLGFFFTKKPNDNKYLDIADEYPVGYNSSSGVGMSYVKPYTQKSGKLVKGYWKYKKAGNKTKLKENSVFSVGLRPVRFIYDTKQEIKQFFAENRSLGYKKSGKAPQELKDKLKSFKNRPV